MKSLVRWEEDIQDLAFTPGANYPSKQTEGFLTLELGEGIAAYLQTYTLN